MFQDIVKVDENKALSLENLIPIKEEFQDEYYPDNKVSVFETTITGTVNASNSALNGHMSNNKIKKYEILSIDHIKTDLPSSEVKDKLANNVKIEDGICPAGIQIEFCNELLYCSHCREVSQDYCTKCRVLVHILNKIPSHNTYNRVGELPKYMLETRESSEHSGIFCLKVIPENVKFGPFTGLNSTGVSLRIKEGRFVVNDDKSERLNWMQYINAARNIHEQNLFPFQYEDKLYYYSTRRIEEGEELLVYFGEEYEDSLLRNVEMDFVPITKKDVENVFACTFCCLGFSTKKYLAEHKSACHGETNELFSVEELAQCPFCKIYLEAKEYFEHHKDYCCERNVICLGKRYCVFPPRKVHKRAVETRSSLRNKGKIGKRIYKCTQCKFRTMYNADFRRHTNEHCEVKMYKCRICDRRYKTQESLRAHVEKIHADNEGDVKKYTKCDYSKVNIKNIKETSLHSDIGQKQCQTSKCVKQIRDKCPLKSLLKIKHPNRGKHKCAHCEFKTYYRSYLEMHMKIKHLMESYYKCNECHYQTIVMSNLKKHIKTKHLKQLDFKCAECEYKTYSRSRLKAHVKTKHLKEYDYICGKCEYKTNWKSCFEVHVKTIHLKERSYKCAECEYKTNFKTKLEKHIKTIHLKEYDYKCGECKYETNYMPLLKVHVKTIHLKERDYKCTMCEYKTNRKAGLKVHVKTIHLKERDYKCAECEYKTNFKTNLEKHIKTMHLKEYDYKCAECEYKTNFKSDLKAHVKTKHLKEHDYKCADCEFKTNFKTSLRAHVNTKHLKEADFKCTECEYKTNRRPYLEVHFKTKHLKEHDYICTECEYKTNRKASLGKHIKTIHLKELDYKCAECEYKTNNTSNLEAHVKTKHLNEYDYKCAECEYKTNNKSHFERHVKRMHLKNNDYKCA